MRETAEYNGSVERFWYIFGTLQFAGNKSPKHSESWEWFCPHLLGWEKFHSHMYVCIYIYVQIMYVYIYMYIYSEIILWNIHVSLKVFAGHSGLFSPAQGLQFQWTLSLRVEQVSQTSMISFSGLLSQSRFCRSQWIALSCSGIAISVWTLSLRVFGWHVLYIRFTFHLYPYKNHEGNFERSLESFPFGVESEICG